MGKISADDGGLTGLSVLLLFRLGFLWSFWSGGGRFLLVYIQRVFLGRHFVWAVEVTYRQARQRYYAVHGCL